MKLICTITALFFVSFSFAQNYYLLTGTYTRGISTGIYVYQFNSQNGSATIVDSIQTSNPSYLAVSANGKFVYAVNEGVKNGDSDKISAFAFNNKTGKLSLLNEVSCRGKNPCYVTIDKTGKWVMAGNYSSGNLVVLPVQNDGSLGDATTVIQHYGSGPKARQAQPHVHATVLSPDNKFLYVPDLGIDKIMAYAFNSTSGTLTPAKDSAVVMQPGAGPRHFDFSPNGKWAYLLQELSGEVTAFAYKKGKLKPVQTISMLPPHYTGYFTSADIHVSPNGRYVYASTRDSLNNIAIFKTDALSGKLTLVGHQSTLGRTPRNFNFDPSGNFLLVANQNTHNIVVFRIDHVTGLLTDTGNRIEVGHPVCLKWVSVSK